ncbi:MAG TPA: sensor domain-containing diguanylate cyclase [Egibacteraceae bacterium]|nr:sensor domain-containing diguanylate cyclase [Egibacteraceae bacterium]
MGLRSRLTLFFMVITVMPLTFAVIAVQLQIGRQLRVRAASDLLADRAVATATVGAQRARAGDLADELVRRGVGTVVAGGDPAAAQAWLDDAVAEALPQRADFVVLVDPGGEPLASAVIAPEFDGLEAPGADELGAILRTRRLPSGVLAQVRVVRGVQGDETAEQMLGGVVSGIWLDDELLRQVPLTDAAAFVAGSRVLASSQQVPEGLAIAAQGGDEAESVEVDGRRLMVASGSVQRSAGLSGDAFVLVWRPVESRASALPATLALLLLPMLAAAAIGWVLAGGVISPVRRAADVARAVAGGDLRDRLEPRGGRELADLATALNLMSTELGIRMREVERSRDELRRSLARLGATLSSSLDLNRTLAVVVETAMDTLVADRGALLLFTPERDALYTKIGRGLGKQAPRMLVGEGLAGYVARTGNALRLPADAEEAPEPAHGEPVGASQLIVPMLGRGRIIGVLSLFRDEGGPEFTQDDLDTMRSFAGQASVAVENVMLHQEAQRLSITDQLTGLWNLRYFNLQAEREIEGARRSGRPLSVAIIDIDHFKSVNDTYGHQVGDMVLIEVASRMRDSTRAPDVVARYGGEEFVALLPGTGLEGGVTMVERIRAAVAASPVETTIGARQLLTVTCSVGIATFPDHGSTLEELVGSADAALYAAKSSGRNRVIAAGTGDSTGAPGHPHKAAEHRHGSEGQAV